MIIGLKRKNQELSSIMSVVAGQAYDAFNEERAKLKGVSVKQAAEDTGYELGQQGVNPRVEYRVLRELEGIAVRLNMPTIGLYEYADLVHEYAKLHSEEGEIVTAEKLTWADDIVYRAYLDAGYYYQGAALDDEKQAHIRRGLDIA